MYLKGTNFRNVEQAEITVAVGRIRFLVSNVTDDVITCVAEIPSNVQLDSNVLQVRLKETHFPSTNMHFHQVQFTNGIICTVNSRYLDFGYLESPLISKRNCGPCFNTEI